ncbi:MAG: cell division protein FtsZ [Flavobacteriaceae bacterium]|nr:cell division protein FtsZ [Flavobacteriaceae bacterium]
MSEETMDNIPGNFNFDLPKNRSNVIKVIGIGGGGGNAINYMFQQGIMGVDFVICNTDSQALEKSSVPIKIQLGASLTEGLGAGANPDVGRQAAQESLEDVKTLLSTQTKMIFITAGMGGGTGTGAAPIIAKMAREMDILTVGIVTMPFQFEGKIRLEQAQKGLEELKSSVDSLIVINNNKLREVYGNLGFKAGFAKADEVLATAARGIAEVITHHYTQNIDLKDAKTVLSNSGSAIMGSAIAEGANRAQESIVKALDSPLLNDNKIAGCKNVLLLIVSGEEEITIDEIGEINDFIQTEAGNNTNIIMGVGEDPALGSTISVTIIATGFNSEQQHEIVNTEAKKIIHTLEEEQPLIQDLTQEKAPQSIFEVPIETPSDEPIIKYSLEDEADEVKPVLDPLPKVVLEEFEASPKVTNQALEVTPQDESIDQITINAIEVDDVQVVSPNDGIEVVDTIVVAVEENPLIATTQEIASLEVIAEQVTPIQSIPSIEAVEDVTLEDDFVFNEIDSSINEIDVVDHELIESEEKQQIQFEFELPIQKELTSQEIEVPQTIEEPIATVFQLEEIKEAPVNQLEELQATEIADIELKVIAEIPENEEAKQALPPTGSSPFDQSIRESINLQNEKRKEQLKQFNYTFNNNINRIEEMERQPAYKRLGFELDGTQEEQAPSTLSLDSDSNDDIQLRSNNSFLHDNVD